MSSREPATSPPKPLLRGWLDAAGAVAALLAVIWGLGLAGVVGSFFTLRRPRGALILLYIGRGWIWLTLLPQMRQAISLQPVLLLVLYA